jgi:hypothetical protein
MSLWYFRTLNFKTVYWDILNRTPPTLKLYFIGNENYEVIFHWSLSSITFSCNFFYTVQRKLTWIVSGMKKLNLWCLIFTFKGNSLFKAQKIGFAASKNKKVTFSNRWGTQRENRYQKAQLFPAFPTGNWFCGL